MKFFIEVWTVPTPDDEEPCELDMIEGKEFTDSTEAMCYAWDRMEEGYFTKLWRR